MYVAGLPPCLQGRAYGLASALGCHGPVRIMALRNASPPRFPTWQGVRGIWHGLGASRAARNHAPPRAWTGQPQQPCAFDCQCAFHRPPCSRAGNPLPAWHTASVFIPMDACTPMQGH